MNTRPAPRRLLVLSAALLVSVPTFAQDEPKRPATDAVAPQPKTQLSADQHPDEAEMMRQMMELSKLNENHKLLASLAGPWTSNVKMWMGPGAPIESKGTALRKPMMDGRYFVVDYTGKMPMPGPDGKTKELEFKGSSIEAYDNVKKKFIATWQDSMSTGIFISEGDYDPATKTFTYTGEAEMVPGMKTKVRETVKIVDNDHHVFEYFESRGGRDVKTMEISYTRKK